MRPVTPGGQHPQAPPRPLQPNRVRQEAGQPAADRTPCVRETLARVHPLPPDAHQATGIIKRLTLLVCMRRFAGGLLPYGAIYLVSANTVSLLGTDWFDPRVERAAVRSIGSLTLPLVPFPPPPVGVEVLTTAAQRLGYCSHLYPMPGSLILLTYDLSFFRQ